MRRMKKQNFLLICFIVIFSCPGIAHVRIDYRISQTHGLLTFLLSIAGTPQYAGNLAEVYRRNPASDHTDYILQLKEFNGILDSLTKTGIDLARSPIAGRNSQKTVLGVLVAQSILAKNLDDFKERSLELLPLREQDILFKTLKKLQPLYEKYIWRESLKDLKKSRSKLERIAKEKQLDTKLEKAKKFLRGQWPEDTPFIVGLYPIPYLRENRENISAGFSSSHGIIVQHGVTTGFSEPDPALNLSVVFHEICHSLYASQTDEVMKELANSFTNSKSPLRFQASTWFNETLATAIGNGWIYQQLNPSGEQGKTWYHQANIDTFAKALFPLVKESLEKEKPIDANFVQQAIEVYEKTFPDAFSDVPNILQHTFILHNSSFLEAKEPQRVMETAFRQADFLEMGAFKHEHAVRALSEVLGAKLILFNEEDVKPLQELLKKFPVTSSCVDTVQKMKNRSYFAFHDNKTNNTFLFAKLSKHGEYIRFVRLLRRMKKVNFDQAPVEF